VRGVVEKSSTEAGAATLDGGWRVGNAWMRMDAFRKKKEKKRR